MKKIILGLTLLSSLPLSAEGIISCETQVRIQAVSMISDTTGTRVGEILVTKVESSEKLTIFTAKNVNVYRLDAKQSNEKIGFAVTKKTEGLDGCSILSVILK